MYEPETAVVVADNKPEPTFAEWSADGALMIELDAAGDPLRCQLEPEVNATWTADVLADRIMRLHRLALMRARCAHREWMNEHGAGIAPRPAYPTESEVAEYRRSIDF
ncbi:hypothetical protein [Mycobacterium kyorinense]|uniref:hypothetical protein n=1 Tax=Mycobacterium kyorinense TaxID=487514 RepID=UPI0005EDF08C|nr:hypothetical protein [Mycobacterium kyorinense]